MNPRDDLNSQVAGALTWSTSQMAQAVSTLRGHVMWNGQQEFPDDDGGTAGVREPRRPHGPTQPPFAAALALV